MQSVPIHSMAIVVNPLKEGGDLLADRIQVIANQLGVRTIITSEYPLGLHALDDYELCCVIGGDGTILGAVPEAARSNTPILGVNLGKLGFLATYTPDEIIKQLENILEGDYCYDERSLIEARCDGENHTHIALNDVVIKSTSINLLRLVVYEETEHIADYTADGLIFSTPTGSSAYNLSAGGPILHPQNCSIAMTPICAHTLSNRSFIFPDETLLRVECCKTDSNPHISIDGRALITDEKRFPLHIRMAKQRNRLIHAASYSHYQVLRTKLKWM